MCTKFQVDWTSASSKTTLTKNFNLNGRTDGRKDERTNERTHERKHKPENIINIKNPREIKFVRK